MDSLRKRILVDAVAKLNASALRPVSAPNAEAGVGATAAIPSVLVYINDDEARRSHNNRSPVNLRTLHLEVEVRVKGAPAAAYDEADPFLRWVTTLDGVILDGAVAEASESITTFTIQQRDQTRTFLLATVHINVPYQQRVGDATLPA